MKLGIDDDGLMTLLSAWDDVSAAIDRVVTALPGQMTIAAQNLEESRQAMRVAINKVTRPTAGRAALSEGKEE